MPQDALQNFHPILAEWFKQTFKVPTDVQVQAWASIERGQHTLIAAPTGSGKTLAGLLPGLNQIIQSKQATNAKNAGIRLLYITPLKALNNDIHHHVVEFIEQLDNLAALEMAPGMPAWPGLRVAVRTGDTPQSTRASILRRPPDILVTTPESLYLMMTSEKARGILQEVEQVVVDEIHDLARDKRGVHLSLTLERLVELFERPFLRIGVSATQKPLQRVAAFLGGWDEGRLRPVEVIESHAAKAFELRVTVPKPVAATQDKQAVWQVLIEAILQEMEGTRSTLIFVNSRRLCERLTQQLNDHCGGDFASSHHGSVSLEMRLAVERRLKQGELRCLVATSSLELGIDVGHIDLVIQIDSPAARHLPALYIPNGSS